MSDNIDPVKDKLRRANSHMIEDSRQVQQGPIEAYKTRTLLDYLNNSPSVRQEQLQADAEEAQRLRKLDQLVGKIKNASGDAKVTTQYADGGVVSPQPSRWQQILDRLMGRDLLQQAAGNTPPPAPPPNQDTSAVAKAAADAAARMETAKKANGGVAPKQYACGGVVGFMGKETGRGMEKWRYGK